MEYVFAGPDVPDDLEDWEDDLVVRRDEPDGFEKHSPEETLATVFVEGHEELFHPPERHRPGLFDVQIGAVALAASVLWEELHPTFGAVMIRNIQLERVQIDKYSTLDPSEIEDGIVWFRYEIEASYPQYRRAMVTTPVKITDGRPHRGLCFIDTKGRRSVLSKEAFERYMGVKEWFTLSRPPDVGLALIDRVEHTDFPSYMRSRMTWDVGF